MAYVKGLSAAEEKGYMASKYEHGLMQLRIVFGVLAILYGLFGYLDYLLIQDHLREFLFIRFGIVIPLFLSLITLTYFKIFPIIWQQLLLFNFIAGGTGISCMLILNPENISYYGGMFMVIFSGYFLIKLNTVYAMTGGLINLFLYVGGFMLYHQTMPLNVFIVTAFFAGSNIIGALGNYQLEQISRIKYKQEKEIQEKNRQLEEVVSEQHKELMQIHKAVESTSDAIAIFNPQGQLQYNNRAYTKLTGYSREELQEISQPAIIHAGPGKLEKIFASVMQGKSWKGEQAILSRSQGTVMTLLQADAVKDEDGNILGLVTTYKDITQRKQAEDALRKSEERFIHLFERAPLAYQSLDAHGYIIEVNEAWLTNLGYEGEEVIGRWFGDFLATDSVEIFQKDYPVFKEEGKMSSEYAMLHRNGERRIIAFEGRIGYKQDGSFEKTHCILQDVTQRKLAEEALRRIEWMLDKGRTKSIAEIRGKIMPPYGKLTEINTERTILDAIDEDILIDIARDYLSLLETSTAIYEKNGDYALDIYSSGWCKFLDVASRERCQTRDNETAIKSGRWLCHESCWRTAAKFAIEKEQPIDISCNGGIRLYTVPIFVNQEVVGAIKLGYGDPPRDPERLQQIAEKYEVDLEKLTELSRTYESRPPFIVELAKERLHSSARLIGALIELNQAEEDLRRSERNYREIFNSTKDAIFIHDGVTGEIIDINESALRMYKIASKDEMIKGDMGKFSNVEDGYTTEKAIENVKNARFSKAITFDWHAKDKDGEKFWVEVSLKNTQIGDMERILAVVRDITERKQAEENMRHMSFHDQLTGLYNRAYLDQETIRIDTMDQLPISIIMSDLNGLKLVNDTYGHATGDEVLKCVARILSDECREKGIIARWGGDEFVILLPQTSEKEALSICRRVAMKIEEAEVEDVPVSIALGVASKERRDKKIEDILREAEDNMYKQKLTESRSNKSDVLKALLKTLGEKSFETETHARRMQKVAQRIGEKLGLSDVDLNRLHLLITLHDIGKINISEEILTKKGPLTVEEWKVIRKHPEIGYRIARATDDFAHVAEDILSHHERWDGTGYPRGLKGKEIPLLARIATIADAYEVMSNGRPYKKALHENEIIAEFKRCAGTQFDPELIEKFLIVLGEGLDINND